MDIQAGLAWPDPRFTDNGDDTLTDNLTGLMWEKIIDDTDRTWEEALTYCNGLPLAGHNDWRLPNINELESLVNYSATDQTVWLSGPSDSWFENTLISDLYWSSTTTTGTINAAFLLHVGDNEIVWDIKENDRRTIAVRGTSTVIAKTGQVTSHSTTGGEDGDLQMGVSWPDPRFTPEEDVIIDKLTGLMWQKETSTTSYDWADAINEANIFGDGKYSDWRIANIREQRSLVNYGQSNPMVWLNEYGQEFGSFTFGTYWASTTNPDVETLAWVCTLYKGTVSDGLDKAGSSGIFFVRAGEVD